MATLEFGTTQKTADEYIAEIYDLIKAKCPLAVTVSNGELKNVSVETSWKEGETVPVESVDEEGKTVIEYEEDYTEKSLTQKQIADLNKYMQDNIEQ